MENEVNLASPELYGTEYKQQLFPIPRLVCLMCQVPAPDHKVCRQVVHNRDLAERLRAEHIGQDAAIMV